MIQRSVLPLYDQEYYSQIKTYKEQALFVIQSSLVFLHVSKGFGKSRELVRSEDLVHIQKVLSLPEDHLDILTSVVGLHQRHTLSTGSFSVQVLCLPSPPPLDVKQMPCTTLPSIAGIHNTMDGCLYLSCCPTM